MEYLYEFTGIVTQGKKRGKQLGFPTANVLLTHNIPEGIYISHLCVEGKTYPALTFIGPAKTYHETLYQSETYIFDFDKSLYNREVSVKIIKKIRDNKKFANSERLINAMEEDKRKAIIFFNKSSE